MGTKGLRRVFRVYVFAVTGVAALLLVATADVPDLPQLARAFLFAGVAAVAQLRPIHISQNIKATAEDAATFAAALTLGPFLSGLVAASSTIVASATLPGNPPTTTPAGNPPTTTPAGNPPTTAPVRPSTTVGVVAVASPQARVAAPAALATTSPAQNRQTQSQNGQNEKQKIDSAAAKAAREAADRAQQSADRAKQAAEKTARGAADRAKKDKESAGQN